MTSQKSNIYALERGSKIKWVQNLKQSLEMFGWGAICVEEL